MRKILPSVIVLLTAAAVLAPQPAAAQPPSVVATINGGGTANMDDGQGTSLFAMGVKLLSDGSARGNFECVDDIFALFPGNFFGPVTSWSLNADGTVSFSGIGKLVNLPGGLVATDLPYTVTIQQFGGPGVGHWTLDVPAFGGIVCIETLTSGRIVLH